MTNSDNRIAELERKLEAAVQTITAMQAHTQRVDVARVALSRNGITDPGAADHLAAQIGQTDDGRWVAVDENGIPRVGDDAGYYVGLDRLVGEYRTQNGTAKAEGHSHGKDGADETVNPFVRGPNYSITAQMVMMKNDPKRAEHLQYVASVGRT